ncbi:hypothetical protein DL89DRAFT_267471 [Linderina pennispora]|uniref:Zn(2)-C6 fungal-type domain-containing protein n=1 Tax=Linderina pennispora TaxID=61395 RepID=A0A1Y1W9M9_9FUNG|nr:uncharacterized protein DL89DRAFT_267471 [Linderina pennispora]ORX70250.1 hypothetical protein DL89DRAFT_267471 [Linderina pennispora]
MGDEEPSNRRGGSVIDQEDTLLQPSLGTRSKGESNPKDTGSPGIKNKSTAALALLRLRQGETKKPEPDASKKFVYGISTTSADQVKSTLTLHLKPIAPMESSEDSLVSRTQQPKFGHFRKQRCKQACEYCHIARTRCDGGNPCENCLKLKITCKRRAKKKRGPKPKSVVESSTANPTIARTPSAADIANLVISDDAVRANTSRTSPQDPSEKRRSASPKDKK